MIVRYFIMLFLILLFKQTFAQTDIFTVDGKKVSVQDLLEQAEIKEKQGDFREASRFLNQAAMIEWEKKSYGSAIGFFQKSLKHNETIQNKQGMLGLYSNLAMIYADYRDYERSFVYFEKTLEGRREGKDKESLYSALINSSVVLNQLKRYDKAVLVLEEALEIARSANSSEQMKSCYGMLAETYEKAGNTAKMMHYFELYRSFHELTQKDKVEKYKASAEESRLRSQLLEMENKNKELSLYTKELEIKKQESKLKEADKNINKVSSQRDSLSQNLTKEQLANKVLEQESAYNLAIISKEQQIKNLLIGVLMLMLVLGGLFYRNYREKKQTNKRLSEQNEEIMLQQTQILRQKRDLEVAYLENSKYTTSLTQSIAYAKRIQTATLPTLEAIKLSFSNSFVFFQPKDVVSGDFYWFYQHEDKVLMAAVDCTGHGVPGAFMSMIGINLMNQIASQGIWQPSEFLKLMNIGISVSLHQNQTENRDGMEAALICYKPKEKKLFYAGARRPLVMVKNGELSEISPDKNPIGGQYKTKQTDVQFDDHEIDVQKNDAFYLFSDGYQDQFGGENNRKFMLRNLKKMLLENSALPMNKQQEIFSQTFNKWKNGHAQIDDVLLIGFSI